MHLQLRHIVFIPTLFAALGSLGQNTCNLKLTGQIRYDLGVNLPCQITLNDTLSIVSDQNGAFGVSDMCPGTYSVRLRCGGRSQKIETFTLTSDTSVVWSVQPDEILDLVDVQADRPEAKTFSKQTALSGTSLRNADGLTLAEKAANIPGVFALKTGGTIAKPMIRGFYGRRVVVYSNGVRLEGQDWGAEHGPEINGGSAESITVVKGPSALRYAPDAIGGLLLVNTFKQADSAGVFADVQTEGHTNGRGGSVSGIVFGLTRKQPVSWFASGSVIRTGNQHTPGYYLKNTGTSGRNFSAGIRYAGSKTEVQLSESLYKNRIGIFTGSHIGNLNDLYTVFNSQKPFDSTGFSYTINRPYQNVLHEQTGLEVTHRPNGKNTFTAGFFRQYNKREEYDKDLPLNDSLAALNLPDFSLELTSYSAALTWDKRLNGVLSVAFGFSGKKQINTHEHREFIPNFTNDALGAFWTGRYRKKRSAIETGIRYDRNLLSVYKRNRQNAILNPKHRYEGASASLNWIYYAGNELTLNTSLATGWRSPWVNELYSNGFHHGVAALEYGNEKLVPERSYVLSFSPDLVFKRLSISAEGFIGVIHDFIFLQPGKEPILTAQGAFPVFYYEQTSVFSGGMDLQANWKLKRLEFNVKTSLIRTQTIETSSVLPGTPSDRFALGGRYRFKVQKAELATGLELTHVAKQWRISADQDFVPLPGAYNLLSASFSIEIPTRSQPVYIVLLASNLLNTEYRNYLNRFRYYTNDIGRNFTVRVFVPFQMKKSTHEQN